MPASGAGGTLARTLLHDRDGSDRARRMVLDRLRAAPSTPSDRRLFASRAILRGGRRVCVVVAVSETAWAGIPVAPAAAFVSTTPKSSHRPQSLPEETLGVLLREVESVLGKTSPSYDLAFLDTYDELLGRPGGSSSTACSPDTGSAATGTSTARRAQPCLADRSRRSGPGCRCVTHTATTYSRANRSTARCRYHSASPYHSRRPAPSARC